MLGAIKGLIIIWIFFLVLSITSTIPASQDLTQKVCESNVLKLLYENNVLLDIVGNLHNIIF